MGQGRPNDIQEGEESCVLARRAQLLTHISSSREQNQRREPGGLCTTYRLKDVLGDQRTKTDATVGSHEGLSLATNCSMPYDA